MCDDSELKRLAETATPGPWSYDGSYVCTTRVEDGTTYVETWRSVADCAQPENTKFIAAANPNFVLVLLAKFDHLKAELAGLRTGYDAYEKIVADLRAENEALRKNAERYEWLRIPENASEIEHLVWTAESMDHFDSEIDRGMSKEPSHD